ncbi:MAG: carbonic anhydrase family protein [Burkholderiales bacterium]|nr:carbonic anhydrase family protein [Burkholderiales bacterium]
MRRYPALLISLILALSAQASEPTHSTPIKQASAKDEASVPEKTERKSSSSKEKEARDKEAKEALAADEIAKRIADRLAVIRKEKDDASARSNPNPRIIVRRPSYTPVSKRADTSKAKPEAGANGAAEAALMHANIHWSYQGEGGPQNWGKIDPANAKCDTGNRQSPIDIRDGIHVDLDPIVFDYSPSRFSVVDNGHTIQVNVGAGNYISILGHNYELVQFHFHKPSEERVNGKSFEMVVHLVHKDADGKLAVIAVLIQRGKAHNIIQQVWNNLPLEKNDPVQPLTPMDISQLLPTKKDYYTYMGSLTTPPCSEGVLWMVMKQPIEISPEQLAIFSRLYPMNARPVQKSSGRLIKESN